MCLYDSKKDIFIAARDRYGVKPLFWRRDKAGRIWFAAEIKAFLETDWHSEWDVEAIASGGWGQDTRTVFRDVQKVSMKENCLLPMSRFNNGSSGPDTTWSRATAASQRSVSTGISPILTK